MRLRRLFGFNTTNLFDPFLLLDDFRSDTPEDFIKGFPWHPHRGIETITYVLKGNVEHGDSLGNQGTISSGDVQWMTAGSGIIHQEMPKGDAMGGMHGFQLWANLPAKEKMMPPRYRDITGADIPSVKRPDGTLIKVIAGSVEDINGPVDDVMIDPEYLDCTIPAATEFTHPTNRGYTVFLYVIGGEGTVNSVQVANATLVLFEDGDYLSVMSGSKPLRFLLLSGKPLQEPVAWRGPIVMNTEEELDQAYSDLEHNSFLQ